VLLLLCVEADAQQPKRVFRIGYLASNEVKARIDAFRQGLRDLGYTEGKDVIIEYRIAEGKTDRLPKLAQDLIAAKVEVIFAQSTPALEVLTRSTRTIPIVSVSGDPLGEGLIASLANPGRNVTGLTNLTSELAGKRLEILKEIIPDVSLIAVLWQPAAAGAARRMKETQQAAPSLAIKLLSVELSGTDGFEPAFGKMKRERSGGFVTLRGPLIENQKTKIVEAGNKNRLPAMYDDASYPELGGLTSYGPILNDLDRRAATYVHKILKGAKPADLPVELPIKFEFVINLKAATQIGLTITPNVVVRADRVIR
jgi:putative ABC transport system substrate-binding protein